MISKGGLPTLFIKSIIDNYKIYNLIVVVIKNNNVKSRLFKMSKSPNRAFTQLLIANHLSKPIDNYNWSIKNME